MTHLELQRIRDEFKTIVDTASNAIVLINLVRQRHQASDIKMTQNELLELHDAVLMVDLTVHEIRWILKHNQRG